jgi:hypothetical protein
LEKESIVARFPNVVCMNSSLLEWIIVIEFHATGSYSSLNLTKEKYSIDEPSVVENDNAN